MKNEVNARIRQLIRNEKTTNKAFCKSIGISESTLKTIFSRDSNPNLDILVKISNEYPHYALNWMLKGEGEIFLNDTGAPLYDLPKNSEQNIFETNQSTNNKSEQMPGSDFKFLPLINLDAVGGYNNDELDTIQYVKEYIPFIDAKDNDICCPVTGNSMSPTYPGGCIVQLRKIESWREYIEFGHIYVLDLTDGRRLIKEIRKGETKEYFRLISHNEKFDETEIPTSLVHSVWLVVAKHQKSVM